MHIVLALIVPFRNSTSARSTFFSLRDVSRVAGMKMLMIRVEIGSSSNQCMLHLPKPLVPTLLLPALVETRKIVFHNKQL